MKRPESSGGKQRPYEPLNRVLVIYRRLWVPETLPWSLTCRDGGRC